MPGTEYLSTPTAALPQARWDELAAGSNFFVSWPWLASLEHALGLRGRLIVAGEAAQVAVPLYEFARAPANPRYDLRRFAALTGTPAESWAPQAIAGGVAGYAGGVLAEPGIPAGARAQALAALGAAVHEASLGYGSAALSYLTADDASALSQGLPGWHAVRADVEVSVPVRAGGFDAWVADLPSSRRAVVRRDIARDHGELAVLDVRELAPEAARLIAQVQQRHAEPASVSAFEEFLGRCAWIAEQHVPAPAFVSFDPAGRMRAVALGFVWGGTLTMRAVGLDYAAIASGSDYFHVLCYEPVRYAIANGLHRVHLGIGGLRTKLLRGGAANPLWTLLRVPATVDAEPALAEYNTALLTQFSAELGNLLGPTGSPPWHLCDQENGAR